RLMPLVWMSRSAMPAARIAAITLSIFAALAGIAALASAAWVPTPVELVATCGSRVALASADTDSRVPSAYETWLVGVWAEAVIGAPRASVPSARVAARASGRSVMVDSGAMRGKGATAAVGVR